MRKKNEIMTIVIRVWDITESFWQAVIPVQSRPIYNVMETSQNLILLNEQGRDLKFEADLISWTSCHIKLQISRFHTVDTTELYL